MFVLIVANGYPTKEYKRGIFALDQAKALKSYGHKVALIALDLRSIRRRRKYGYRRFTLEGIDAFSVNVPLGNVPGRLRDRVAKAAFSFAYKQVEKELGVPDVIHAHFYSMGMGAMSVSKDKGIPLVVTEHFSELNKEDVNPKLLERAVECYSCASERIAVSDGFARRLKKNTGFDFRVIPNVVDTEAFSKVCQRDEKEGRPFNFVSVGHLVPIKGFSYLLKAFRGAVDRSESDIRLTIVGDGTERKNLEQEAQQLGIADKVCFKGQLDRSEIAELYADCDCFVLLSRSETFGVAYIEAMAAGLPVVATACGGPEEFVDESSGMIVPLDDEDAHVKALLHMVVSAGQYDKQRIRESAVNRFSPEIIAEELTAVYEETIPKRGKK